MKFSKSKKGLIALLFPFILSAQSAPTLKELIDSAMVNDGNLHSQVLQNKLTEVDNDRLKDVFLPKVDVSGKAGYMYTSAHYKTPELTVGEIPGVYQGYTIPESSNSLNISGFTGMAKAEASMLLYSGGKVKNLQQANKEKSLSEVQLMEKTKIDVITEISKAYDQFALIHESKKTLDESKKRLEINKTTADKALGYGLITPYDHRKIELAQATLDSKIVEYEGKRKLLITQLHLLTGIDKERIALINPSLQRIETIVIDENIDNRAELKALDHGIKASEFKIKAEEKWWIPKVQAMTSVSYVGLYGNHIFTSESLLPGLQTKLDWKPSAMHLLPIFQAGVGFKWDVFDGNEGKAAIETAKINKEILESKKKDAQKLLKLNLANNQTNLEIAESQIVLKKKAKSIAENALSNVEKEFRYGTKKSSDLIDAENDLQNAELDLQTAIFNQRRNAIELLKSTQSLDVQQLQ